MISMTPQEQEVYDLFCQDDEFTWDDKLNRFTAHINGKHANVTFYGDNIMEMEVFTASDTPDFYLQFELKSRTSCRGYIQTFASYLYDFDEATVHPIIRRNHPHSFLFTCTCGASSEFFARYLEAIADPERVDLKFRACEYTKLDEFADRYDRIVLMPQINYKLKEFQKKYGSKVLALNSQDVATRNYRNILNTLLSHQLEVGHE